jgi:hypothetical protein
MNNIPTMNTVKPPSNFPVPPTFETVREKLKILLDAIQQAIGEGTLHVQEYTKNEAENNIDTSLAPNLVRHKAKMFLVASGQDAKNDEETEDGGFNTQHLPNNGICIRLSGFTVRVLKSADDGGVPPPGISLTRQNFYRQKQALLDFEEFRNGEQHVQPTWGLIVHWAVDSEYNLLKLSVALPVDLPKSENGRLLVECEFDEPYWTRPQRGNVVSIDAVPPPTDLNIPGIRTEPEEKTGEDSTEG